VIADRKRFREIRLSRVIVVMGVALTCALAGMQYVKALSKLADATSDNSSLSFEDREIAGGNSIVVDQRAPYEARALIPVSSRYRVVVGKRLRDETPLTKDYIAAWLRYFLMPRRPARDSHWVICYGCDSSDVGNRYEVVWRDREGISIGRLP
jgi:Ni/Co efflux regulator RcnB